jgi:hypothetical protein
VERWTQGRRWRMDQYVACLRSHFMCILCRSTKQQLWGRQQRAAAPHMRPALPGPSAPASRRTHTHLETPRLTTHKPAATLLFVYAPTAPPPSNPHNLPPPTPPPLPPTQAAETFVLTPPGETPPPMGQNFPMTDQDKLRRAGKLPSPRFDTGCILSFSFHSMFLDFQRQVGLPACVRAWVDEWVGCGPWMIGAACPCV